jgi:hypothetical protein
LQYNNSASTIRKTMTDDEDERGEWCCPSLKYVPYVMRHDDAQHSSIIKEKHKEEKLERDKQRYRSNYFCIGYSQCCKELIHILLKKLTKTRFDLWWLLRISICPTINSPT